MILILCVVFGACGGLVLGNQLTLLGQEKAKRLRMRIGIGYTPSQIQEWKDATPWEDL